MQSFSFHKRKLGHQAKKYLFGTAVLFAAVSGSLILQQDIHIQAASKGVKIRYNNKTRVNKSKRMNVKYNTKTVSKSSYKALVINKSYMVPYTDIFKSGIKASCKYSSKSKTLTITKNSVTIKMKVGSKTAYVNGKKKKLSAAPLSVRFVSKKKTKIMVPVSFVAKTLHLSYKKSGSTITIGDPLLLSYDGQTTYYTGAQGSIYYNHKDYKLSNMPVIKISGNMYMPAEEVLDGILNLKYDYNKDTGKLTVSNEDTNTELTAQLNSVSVTLNGKPATINAPLKLVKNLTTNKEVLCIPASGIAKQLGYTRSWDKSGNCYKIQSKLFFDWHKNIDLKTIEVSNKLVAGNNTDSSDKAETTPKPTVNPDNTQKPDTTEEPKNTPEPDKPVELNYIYAESATYSEDGGTGAINLNVTGSSSEIMQKITVKRNGNIITISIPQSQYMLDKNLFNNFGEIVQKMEVTTSEDNTVCITLTCEGTTDFSYTIQKNTLVMNLLYTYSSSTGSVTNYSLSIPKPSGVTISQVTNQDLYASKKFRIDIKGDYVEFFRNNPVVINNNTVKSIEVTKSGANTRITVTTSSLRGYKIYDKGKEFVVSMGAPKSIYKSIVVMDAGHGGHDPGARNKGTNEKDLNFKIAYTLMKQYASQNAPDIKIYWTRTTDSFVTLAKRSAFAKSMSADAFISLHMNSASGSSANGTEVYYSVSNNSKGFGGITSKKMANLFKTKLIGDLKTKNRGVKTAGYYVLKHNTVPSILIELGFISGSSDYKKLTNADFQKKAAKSIYEGIQSMFNTYKTGR